MADGQPAYHDCGVLSAGGLLPVHRPLLHQLETAGKAAPGAGGGAEAPQPAAGPGAPGRPDRQRVQNHLPVQYVPRHPLNNLVYAASKANVLMTVVNGAVRYEKGEYFVGEDVDRIYQKCQDITDRIMER